MNKENLTSGIEDYLEAIYVLNQEKDKIGTSDIAGFLGVKLPSVTEMLEKLEDRGLINYEKYGEISLTDEGNDLAEKVSERHEDIMNFLKLLGVDEEDAHVDACKIEHVVGDVTMEKLREFINFVEDAPKDPVWLKHYEEYLETGEHPDCE